MTAHEILSEIRRQMDEHMMERGFAPDVIYISKEYIETMRRECGFIPRSKYVKEGEKHVNTIMNLPFFTVLEEGHIDVT